MYAFRGRHHKRQRSRQGMLSQTGKQETYDQVLVVLGLGKLSYLGGMICTGITITAENEFEGTVTSDVVQ